MPTIVDLFCGIGGVAEAIRPGPIGDRSGNPAQSGDTAQSGDMTSSGGTAPSGATYRIVAAIDIDRRVGPIYMRNHGVRPRHQTLESVDSVPQASLWWLSPPCQPYTRRGRGLGELDPRSAPLEHLIGRIADQRPPAIALENVPPFERSAHHRRLADTLRRAGYEVRSDRLCPTEWGVPMRRPRFYLRAARGGVRLANVEPTSIPRRLADYLDEAAWNDTSLRVPLDRLTRFGEAMRLLDPDEATATANCFTSGYGDSPVRAGGYLVRRARRDLVRPTHRHPASSPSPISHFPDPTSDGGSGRPFLVRHFSPREIGRLMGFRDHFDWPPEISRRARFRLLGNALAVPVVRSLLASFRWEYADFQPD